MSGATANSDVTAEIAANTAVSKNNAKVIAAYLSCALIWGTTWYGIRVCIGAGGYPPYLGAALRFTLSVAILAVIWFLWRNKIKISDPKMLGWVGLAGLFSGVSYGVLYAAEQFISGGLAAVIAATGPLITGLLAAVTKTEKLSRVTIFGSLFALAGISVVFHDRLQVSPEQAPIIIVLLVNVFFSAGSNVVMKRYGRDVPPVASNTVFFLAAMCLLWIFSAASNQLTLPVAPTLAATASLVYLTIFGTLITFAAFFYLLRHVRLSTAMTLAFVTPVVAVIMDHLFEKDIVFTMESYIGIAIVLISVAATVLSSSRSQRRG